MDGWMDLMRKEVKKKGREGQVCTPSPTGWCVVPSCNWRLGGLSLGTPSWLYALYNVAS